MNKLAATCLWTGLILFFLQPHPQAAGENPEFKEGIALRVRGKNSLSVDAFNRAIAASPRHSEALVQKGAALEDMGKLKEAETCYRRALHLDPANASAGRNLDQLVASRNINIPVKAPCRSVEILMRKGLQALESGQFDKALRTFEVLAGLLPRDPRPDLYSALTWERSGRRKTAQAVYRKMIRVFPLYSPARVNLVLSLLESGDRDGAVKEARAALARVPADPRVRCLARLLGVGMKLSEDTATLRVPRGSHRP